MSVCNCRVKNIRPKYNNLKEWMNDKNNVYVGRGGIVFIDKKRYPEKSSIFSNPFKITKDLTREQVLIMYENYIVKKIENDESIKIELLKLKNKNLGCWCYPEMCHADILLKLIEKYDI